MGRNKTGLTDNTKKRLLLGAGAIFKNFVVGVDTYESSKSKIIAATQGGNTFEATPNTHNIQIDGILGVAADLDVIDSWAVSLECNFIETSIDVIKAALGASVVDTASNGSYDIIEGDTEFKATDYLENVTYIGTISGSTTPVIIQIYNAINLGGLSVNTTDDKEGVVTVKFEGRYTIENQENPPFKIFYPKGAGATISVPSELTLTEGEIKVVPVLNPSGTFTASSSASAKCDVEVADDNFIVLTAASAGTATITVTDEASHSDTIAVTVEAGE